ncbi:MAG: TAXI family TRAP transporter solute-binding subunit [Hyphomicrobiales bacterium]|nr:TAXI family TRAP transporter solute-binding subunit [Hyphomicrobiales bacterium]
MAGLIVALCVWVPAMLQPAAAEDISIGTGSTAGVYIRVGAAICKVVSRTGPDSAPGDSQSGDSGHTCRAEPTKGSIANLRDVRAGRLDFAIAQSDAQYFAVNGGGPFSGDGPDAELRALFSVHGEPFTVVARRDSGIRSFDDLLGKRINLGNPGSGQRATMEALMAAKGWTADDFALAGGLPASQQSLALCHDRIQAMVYTVGHPNPSIQKAVSLCEARIIPVGGPDVERFIANRPYFTQTTIPGGLYPGNDAPVATFGVLATVVASAKISPETVYLMVSRVFDNFDLFRSAHPVLMNLKPEHMISDGLSAPLHDGARRYYREKGWLNP